MTRFFLSAFAALAASMLSACITAAHVARPGEIEVIEHGEARYEWQRVPGSDNMPAVYQCLRAERVLVEQQVTMEPHAFDSQENGLMIALGVLQLVGGLTIGVADVSPAAGAAMGGAGALQVLGLSAHRMSALRKVRALPTYEHTVTYWDEHTQPAPDDELCGPRPATANVPRMFGPLD